MKAVVQKTIAPRLWTAIFTEDTFCHFVNT